MNRLSIYSLSSIFSTDDFISTQIIILCIFSLSLLFIAIVMHQQTEWGQLNFFFECYGKEHIIIIVSQRNGVKMHTNYTRIDLCMLLCISKRRRNNMEFTFILLTGSLLFSWFGAGTENSPQTSSFFYCLSVLRLWTRSTQFK